MGLLSKFTLVLLWIYSGFTSKPRASTLKVNPEWIQRVYPDKKYEGRRYMCIEIDRGSSYRQEGAKKNPGLFHNLVRTVDPKSKSPVNPKYT